MTFHRHSWTSYWGSRAFSAGLGKGTVLVWGGVEVLLLYLVVGREGMELQWHAVADFEGMLSIVNAGFEWADHVWMVKVGQRQLPGRELGLWHPRG